MAGASAEVLEVLDGLEGGYDSDPEEAVIGLRRGQYARAALSHGGGGCCAKRIRQKQNNKTDQIMRSTKSIYLPNVPMKTATQTPTRASASSPLSQARAAVPPT